MRKRITRLNVCAALMLLLAAPAVSETDVLRGWVTLWTFPSLAELADAYEKSDKNSFVDVVTERLKHQRDYGIDRVMIPKNAVVEVQTLPDFTIIGKALVDEKGWYSIKLHDDNRAWRVYCCVVLNEFGKDVNFAGSARVSWNNNAKAFEQNISLSRNHVSVCGRCLNKDGSPVENAHIQVSLVMPPAHGEAQRLPWHLAKTDKHGKWRVDGVAAPSYDQLMAYMCNTNLLNVCDDSAPPLGIKIEARRSLVPAISESCLTIPNVTAADRAAIERILTVSERRNGEKISMPHPLDDFPTSTNNVIYVQDIVLP